LAATSQARIEKRTAATGISLDEHGLGWRLTVPLTLQPRRDD